jgi:polygalacturonase
MLFRVFLLLFLGATLVNAGCSATISSLSGMSKLLFNCWYSSHIFTDSSDVADAVKCTTITINGFTVPARKNLTLSLATGTTVTMSEYPIFCTSSSQ